MTKKTNDMSHLHDIVSKFCEDRNWGQYHNPKDLSIMIVTESAELLSIFRYKNEEDIKDIFKNRKEDVEDELADILFGVLRFAELNQIDLGEALENKIKKNNAKYPIDKSYGKNTKYNEL